MPEENMIEKWKEEKKSLFFEIHQHPKWYDEKNKEVAFNGELGGRNDDIVDSDKAYIEVDKLLDKIESDLRKLFEPVENERPYTGEYSMGWNDCLRTIFGEELTINKEFDFEKEKWVEEEKVKNDA